MRSHTFRNTFVESSLSLPFMTALTLLLWLLVPEREDPMVWVSLAIVGITTYVIVEWNNQCQLLRIRSRMNSVTFLAFVCACPALHSAGLSLMPALCLLAAYFSLFKSYGEYRPQGYTFHAFFFLGLGGLFFPPMLLLAPTLFVSSGGQLRVLTGKSIVAIVLGLLLPFWLYAGAMAVAIPLWGVEETRLAYFTDLRLPDYSTLQLGQIAVFAFLVVHGLFSVFHFVNTSYNDKIRTRQYYYTIMLSFVPLLFITLWWPDDALVTLPLLMLNLTPFSAHYIALSKARLINVYFWLCLAVLLAISIGNYTGYLDSTIQQIL